MKAAQIKKYTKGIKVSVNEVFIPEPNENEVIIKVIAAAVNPLDILQLTGSVRLIQDYRMPLTLGNECSGIVEKTGNNVKDFRAGDRVYTRLPINRIGAFAEYAAVDHEALAKMPSGYDFVTAAAIPLAGLTAYQGLIEELEVQAGKALLITGASGGFGQVAVPIAKSMGLRVIVTGNTRSKDKLLKMGADQYIDYKKENYWEVLSDVDYVIDTLGANEFEHELSVLKKGGRLLSLRTAPNRMFAKRNGFSWLKTVLFTLAGSKFDSAARKQGKEYRFMFVRSSGDQLKQVTEIVEKYHIMPDIESRTFSLSQVNEALELMANGKLNGKIIIRI
ncbi:NADP-dependent oxidoreductase [Bacteroides togonis]|uniref:NADP-dependent oxidoreductase n=1 Tax=Bacteroides togonis TaxID=1917883 RepID=UPI00094AC643|nr:NADP-dependent oxidoreductase [Bacteroides togonis]